MAPPMSMTIPELAEQEGITATTLYNWRKQARARGQVLPSRSTHPDQWTSQEKFQIVLETAPMNEAEVSAYCRERGLYPEQVETWRDACMNANDDAAAQGSAAGKRALSSLSSSASTRRSKVSRCPSLKASATRCSSTRDALSRVRSTSMAWESNSRCRVI